MTRTMLRERWDDGEAAVNGWLSIGNAYSAEIAARQGFDSLTIDLQHGMIDRGTALQMLQAVSTTRATPLARVPDNDPAAIMWLLDAGAEGIICPLVNSAEECARFVAACRYPPAGTRSFGPGRAHLRGGPRYTERANDGLLTLAMVETRQAMDALEAILAVDGLDAVFIGPNDLALSLGCSPSSESDQRVVVEAIDHILARTRAAGLKAGIFCSGGLAARERAGQGFDLVTAGDDSGALGRTLAAELAAARNPPPPTLV